METSLGGTQPLTVRVGDAERDACVAALIEHHLHGRLSVEEFDRRQRAALAAVTTGDLRLLLADLPRGDEPAERRTRGVVPGAASGTVAKAAVRVLPAGLVVAGASLSQWAWQYSAEGPFLGALTGGALGYVAHSAIARFRR
jgi:hypothetical protein